MASPPINLSTLRNNELRDFFDSVDTIFSDNDGVLSYLGALAPGTKVFVDKLRTHRKRFKIISNNTIFGRVYTVDCFRKQGIECKEEDIFTPAQAMIHYLESNKFEGKLWVLGSDALGQELSQAGFELARPECIMDLPLPGLVEAYLQDDEQIKAIIIDATYKTSYFSIAKAIRLLNRDPDILLLYGACDFNVAVAIDQSIIGPGYIQDIVNKETGRTAVVLSKPHMAFGDIVVDQLQCTPARTLFIGDCLKSDISFAKKMGFKQLLVLTGVTNMQELLECDETTKPEYFISSIVEFNALLSNCDL